MIIRKANHPMIWKYESYRPIITRNSISKPLNWEGESEKQKGKPPSLFSLPLLHFFFFLTPFSLSSNSSFCLSSLTTSKIALFNNFTFDSETFVCKFLLLLMLWSGKETSGVFACVCVWLVFTRVFDRQRGEFVDIWMQKSLNSSSDCVIWGLSILNFCFI